MKSPKYLGSVKDMKRREKRAFDTEGMWHDQMSDVYEYFLPQRNLFETQNTGQKKMDRIFDSTSLTAIQQAASKLQENIAPIQARWAAFQPSNEVLELLEQGDVGVTEQQVRENLDKQGAIVFDYINRSNFGTQFYEAALDLLIGTATLRIDETDDDMNPVVFHCIPQKGIAFEEGPFGNIETHWRRFSVKARLLERMWRGVEVSQTVRAIIENSPDADLKVCEGVVFEPKAKRYYGCLCVNDEDRFSWIEDFGETSPWVTGRYTKVAGEVRGRGPAMQCLPDVRSLNKAKEFVLQKAAIDLAGMYTATDDGVTNPYNLTIAPGVVIPVGSNNTSNPSIMRLDTGTNLGLAQFEITELQNAIKLALFNDLRDPAGPVRTATEIAIESRELAKRIGSAFGRLQTEVLIPILKRVVSILTRRGLIMPIELDGKDVEVKFTSPLARAQDGEDLLSLQQAVQFVAANAGPDLIATSFKIEDFGSYVAEKTGMSSQLVRSDTEKQQAIEAGAQQEMAQQQAQMPPQQPQLQAVE
jgi:hypothetical protein